MRPGLWLSIAVAAVAASACQATPLAAQGLGEPVIRDTNVGYIDPAVPGNYIRLQYDDVFNNLRPTRNEFFWAPGGAFGRGPATPERSVDYQDAYAYVEGAFNPRFSVFAGVPVRFLNPDLNANTAGLADMNAGFKQALIYQDDLVTSFQLKAYAPTGDVHRGLGTGHVSLEPALLVFKRLSDDWTCEAELRDWIPIDGGDFAGNIIRYGIGAHYQGLRSGSWQLVPIAEFVGWTPLDGQVAVRQSSGLVEVRDTAGSTIVHVKVGARVKYSNRGDVYVGYGRPLTGESWYEDTIRAELRVFF